MPTTRRSRRVAAKKDDAAAPAEDAASNTTETAPPRKRSKRQLAKQQAEKEKEKEAEEEKAKSAAAATTRRGTSKRQQQKQQAKKTATTSARGRKSTRSRKKQEQVEEEQEEKGDEEEQAGHEEEEEEEEQQADDAANEGGANDQASEKKAEEASGKDAAAKEPAAAQGGDGKGEEEEEEEAAPKPKRARRAPANKKQAADAKDTGAAAAAATKKKAAAAKPKGKRLTKKEKQIVALKEKAEQVQQAVKEVEEEAFGAYVPPHEVHLDIPEDKPLVARRRRHEEDAEKRVIQEHKRRAASNPNPVMNGSGSGSSASAASKDKGPTDAEIDAAIEAVGNTRFYRARVDRKDTRVINIKELQPSSQHAVSSYGSGIVHLGPNTIKFSPKGRTIAVHVAKAGTKPNPKAARSKRKITVTQADLKRAFEMTEDEAYSHLALAFNDNTPTNILDTRLNHAPTGVGNWVIKAGGVTKPVELQPHQVPEIQDFDAKAFACGGLLVCPALAHVKQGDVVELVAQPEKRGVQKPVLRINGHVMDLYEHNPLDEAEAEAEGGSGSGSTTGTPSLSRKASRRKPRLTRRKSTKRSLSVKKSDHKPVRIPEMMDLYGSLVVPSDTSLCLHVEGMTGFGQSPEVLDLFRKNSTQLQEWGACGPVVAGRIIEHAVEASDYPLLRHSMQHGQPYLPGPTPRWSADCFSDAKEYAVITNDIKALSILAHNPMGGWAELPSNDIAERTGTGSVGAHTYAHRVGKVGVARGGKEGDSAFIQESELRNFEHVQPYNYNYDPAMLALARSPQVDMNTLNYVLSTGDYMVSSILYAAVEAGNTRTVQRALSILSKDTSSGITDTYTVAVDEKQAIKSTLQARSLLKKGGAISSVTPLHMAAACAPLARFKALLQINSLNYSVLDDYSRTLIHFAAVNEDPGVVDFLLSLGASPVVTDKQHLTPVHLACKHGQSETAVKLIEAARKQFSSQLSALNAGGDDKDKEETPAMKRKKAAMLKKLKVAGLAKDKLGLTPLHHAAYEGHTELFEALHAFDPELDLDLGDRNKRTPLMIAAMQNHCDTMEVLLQLGAYAEARDKRKYSALHHACKNGQFGAAQLLLRTGTDANARDSSGNTPAHYAAAYDWVKVLQLLKHYGAELTAANDWKTTPLSIAVAKSCITCLMYLLEQPGTAVDARDNDGRTLLHHACTQVGPSNLRIVEHLLKQGADPGARDLNNVTPLLLVAKAAGKEEQQLEMAQLLLKAGAGPDVASKSDETPLAVALSKSRGKLLRAMLSSGHSFDKDKVAKSTESFLHKLVGLAKREDIGDIWKVVMEQDAVAVKALLNHRRHSNGRSPIIDLLVSAKHHGSSAALFGAVSSSSPSSSSNSNAGMNRGFGGRVYGWRSRQAVTAASSTSDDSTCGDLNRVVELVRAALQHGYDPDLPVRLVLDKKKGKKQGEAGNDPASAMVSLSDDDDDDSDSDSDSDAMLSSDDDEEEASSANEEEEENEHEENDVMEVEHEDNAGGAGAGVDAGTSGATGEGEAAGGAGGGGGKKGPVMVVPSHGRELTVESSLYTKEAKLLGESEKKPFKIEKQLDNVLGGCTALHVACRVNMPQPLVEALLEGGADPNARDRLGQTPLMYAVAAGIPSVVQKMLEHGADPSAASARSGQTPLHIAVRQCLQAQEANKEARRRVLKLLLDAGAATSTTDKFGELVLCTAVKNTGNRRVADALLKAGADPCKLDGRGTSAFHYAARMCDKGLVQRFLASGADPNLKSSRGNTPLHGVILADGGDRTTELVVLLLDAGADANAKNNEGIFPLYRAVTNSATKTYRNFELEQLLIDRGADIHALTNLHRNILHAAVVTGDKPERLDKKRTPYDPIEIVSDICSLEALDLDVADVHGRTPLHYASIYGAILTARYLIKRKANPNKEDKDGNTALQLALIGHQVNYAALLLDHVHDLKHSIVFTLMEHDKETKKDKEVEHTTSTFRFLASHHFTGLACVFIDHGVDVLSAFRDCVSVGEYQMALTLLRKTSAPRVKALKDADNNTLVSFVCRHISSQKAFQSKFCKLMMTRLTNDYGFSKKTVNVHGETHLHQSAWSGARAAFDAVLPACDVGAQRKDGFDALSLALVGHASARDRLAMVQALLNKGADPNHYDTLRGKVVASQWLKDDERVTTRMKKRPLIASLLQLVLPSLHYNPHAKSPGGAAPGTPGSLAAGGGGGGGRTPSVATMLNATRKPDPLTGDKRIDRWLFESLSGSQTEGHYNAAIAALLLKAGLSWNHTFAETNATLVEQLVLDNELNALERLIALGKAVGNPIDLNHRLHTKGQTVLARRFSSHDNTFAFVSCNKLLTFLVKNGCDINQRDDEGRTALWYAHRVADIHTVEFMQKKLGAALAPTPAPARPKPEHFDAIPCVSSDLDPTQDSAAGLHDVEALLEKKKQEEGKPPGPLVDEPSKLTKVARVVKMDDCDDYYDVTMTVTDVSYGYWGRHDFYRMQVLYNFVQDMHILWTRWGRVGEEGMHQSTPYPTKDAAVAEFCKVFKSKSGNPWENRHNFEPKPNKYMLQRHDHATIARRQEMAMNVIKFEKVPSSQQLPISMDVLLRTTADVKQLSQAIVTDCDFDLAFGGAPAGALEKAVGIIKDLKEATKELESLSWGDDRKGEVNKQVQQLTVEFYQTIPINAVNHRVRMLKYQNVLEIEEKLNTVAVENVTANLLLGAYHRLQANNVNPYDYVYAATGAHLSPVGADTSTYKAIRSYMESTTEHASAGDFGIAQVFEIARPEEDAAFKAKFGTDSTRTLLWHGTKNQNVLGILSQGLRCAPPSAQVTGYMFGKGVYFADCFSKSFNYVHGGSGGSEIARHHGCMFLAEVALGNTERRVEAKMEPPAPGYDSIHGIGRNAPSQTMMTLEDDVKVPLGPLKPSPNTTHLNFNEFILYDSARIRLRYLVLLRDLTWLRTRRRRHLLANRIITSPSDPDPEPDLVLEGDDMWKFYPKSSANANAAAATNGTK